MVRASIRSTSRAQVLVQSWGQTDGTISMPLRIPQAVSLLHSPPRAGPPPPRRRRRDAYIADFSRTSLADARPALRRSTHQTVGRIGPIAALSCPASPRIGPHAPRPRAPPKPDSPPDLHASPPPPTPVRHPPPPRNDT